MSLVSRNEVRQFLNRRDDDLRVRVFKLLLQDGSRRVRVRGSLLEPVVFPHGLVVEVLAVNNEQHLVDPRHLGRELGRLERCQRLARSSGVPDVSARLNTPQLPVVGGNLDLLQDPLCCHDLVGPHHQQATV